MRDKLPAESIFYTVLLGILVFLIMIGVLVAFGSATHHDRALKAVFFLGVLLNILAAVRTFAQRRERGYLLLLAALVCLYFALQ